MSCGVPPTPQNSTVSMEMPPTVSAATSRDPLSPTQSPKQYLAPRYYNDIHFTACTYHMPGTFLSTYVHLVFTPTSRGNYCYYPVSQMRKPERFGTLTRVTQLVNGRVRIQAQAVGLCSRVCSRWALPLHGLGRLRAQPLSPHNLLSH